MSASELPADPWPETWEIEVGDFALVRVLLRVLRTMTPEERFETLKSLDLHETQGLLAVVLFGEEPDEGRDA